MNQSAKRRAIPVLLLALALIAITAPLAAQTGDRWTVRGYALSFTGVDSQLTLDRGQGFPQRGTVQRVSGGEGFGLGIERRFGRHLGVEASALLGTIENDFRLERAGDTITDSVEIDTDAYFLGLDYHLTPDRRFDLTLGAFFGIINFNDVIFFSAQGLPETLRYDDDTGFGAKIGIDVPFRRDGAWSFHAEARYFLALLESEVAGEDLDLDPLIVAVGAGIRF